MTIPLQTGIIYGPVNSRRLGRSLGINVLPTGYKRCTLNCLYCQYGWTPEKPPAVAWPVVSEVEESLAAVLAGLPEPPDYITFSGNGEATLHPDFGELVEMVSRVRDRQASAAKTAILSNSTTVAGPRVRRALAGLDVPIMKLDAGSNTCFQRFNRPAAEIDFRRMVQGLAELPGVTIQSLFAGGPAGNCRPADVQDWLECLQVIQPAAVQIYTLDRGYPSEQIQPATAVQLEEISNWSREENIASTVYI